MTTEASTIASTSFGDMPVWPLLAELGFVPDGSVITDGPYGLSLRRQGLDLQASETVSRYFEPIVMVLGYWRTSRTLSEVHVEMPLTVAGLSQLKALLAHGIGRDCPASADLPWLAEGHELQEWLPWKRDHAARMAELAAYTERRANRPHCQIGRPWMRLFVRELRSGLEGVAPETPCTLTFSGEVLSCFGPIFRVSAPAKGPRAWPEPHVILARTLWYLPKRLMNDPVEVGIWEGALEIDNLRLLDERELVTQGELLAEEPALPSPPAGDARRAAVRQAVEERVRNATPAERERIERLRQAALPAGDSGPQD